MYCTLKISDVIIFPNFKKHQPYNEQNSFHPGLSIFIFLFFLIFILYQNIFNKDNSYSNRSYINSFHLKANQGMIKKKCEGVTGEVTFIEI